MVLLREGHVDRFRQAATVRSLLKEVEIEPLFLDPPYDLRGQLRSPRTDTVLLKHLLVPYLKVQHAMRYANDSFASPSLRSLLPIWNRSRWMQQMRDSKSKVE
mmetsp:Transcript_47723/g.126240  ORF Transcript_47723/g.126240 Transcript_47723/m.126240 type:complete len:103 (+) Transcript_47723:466-774(+)